MASKRIYQYYYVAYKIYYFIVLTLYQVYQQVKNVFVWLLTCGCKALYVQAKRLSNIYV